jgi:hypothetical protein
MRRRGVLEEYIVREGGGWLYRGNRGGYEEGDVDRWLLRGIIMEWVVGRVCVPPTYPADDVVVVGKMCFAISTAINAFRVEVDIVGETHFLKMYWVEEALICWCR